MIVSQLAAHSLRPKSHLGQNFLIDRHIFEKIIVAADLQPKDIVVEIGAGLGSLTRYLAESSQHVIAIEYDRDLIELLKSNVAEHPNVTLVHADALKVDLEQLLKPHRKQTAGQFKVIANLPYQITSPMLDKLLLTPPLAEHMVFMLQDDVAERLLGTSKPLSSLALTTSDVADTSYVYQVSPQCFYPVPRVNSALVSITPKAQAYQAGYAPIVAFHQFIRRHFQQRRKVLLPLLSQHFAVEKASLAQLFATHNIDPRARAENLRLNDWRALFNHLSNSCEARS